LSFEANKIAELPNSSTMLMIKKVVTEKSRALPGNQGIENKEVKIVALRKCQESHNGRILNYVYDNKAS
jgi:hypothetical protein